MTFVWLLNVALSAFVCAALAAGILLAFRMTGAEEDGDWCRYGESHPFDPEPWPPDRLLGCQFELAGEDRDRSDARVLAGSAG